MDAEGGKTYETVNPTDGSVSSGPGPSAPPLPMTPRGPLLSTDTPPRWEAPALPLTPLIRAPLTEALSIPGSQTTWLCHRASHQSRGGQVHTHTHTHVLRWTHSYTRTPTGTGHRRRALRGFEESNRWAVWTQTRAPRQACRGPSAPTGHRWGPRAGGCADASLSPTPTPGPPRWRPELQGRWAPSGHRIQGLGQAY